TIGQQASCFDEFPELEGGWELLLVGAADDFGTRAGRQRVAAKNHQTRDGIEAGRAHALHDFLARAGLQNLDVDSADLRGRLNLLEGERSEKRRIRVQQHRVVRVAWSELLQ